ncbi:MAG: restriction endonuclease-like protein, partial [Anaerolineaceae bacterium]|nr:restriction endonuclease-like protein [Anaerolineaceae bacterium]
NKIIAELDSIEKLIVRLSKLEPFENINGLPPAGFASIQLLSAPGYRDAYQACSILALGLRIEGGPLRLSVKDLNLLYEYWCYIALLRIVSEVLGKPIPSSDLLTIQQRGLQILLQKGRQCNVKFDTDTKRTITLTYNPKFVGENYLVPQQPDILMTMDDPGWPKLQLLFDAKYRIDTTQQYQDQYGTSGPPEDALNVLHRYRDAILEKDGIKSESKRSKRTVVQAAVLFPSHDTQQNPFSKSRLWKSLDKLGVGAVPLLPGETKYLEEWLTAVLHQGGWDLAERVIPHNASDQLMNWRIAASEIVLVAPLRSENEEEHFDWIKSNHLYYMPLLKQQRRQYFTKWVAIYLSATKKEPGSIKYKAKVDSLEVIERKKIKTPWDSSRNEKQSILYHLGEIEELNYPILNVDDEGRGHRFSIHRWTSKLGLDRAKVLSELFLETEPEWRLYENLQANNIKFALEPGSAKVIDPEDPKGRTKFIFDNGYISRYGGAAGFVLKKVTGEEVTHSMVQNLIKDILNSLESNIEANTEIIQESLF